MSESQAAVNEASFFNADPFWSSEPLAHLRDRFGVDNLRRELRRAHAHVLCREAGAGLQGGDAKHVRAQAAACL